MTDVDIKFVASPLPLVSVSITAYNSAKWLARALDSVFAQRVNFPLEIVIGDDCSQDTTLQIAHSYRDRYPDIIRVLERTKNVGIQRNYYETFEQCRGKYIAWLDADDYWTDPEKLTTQVELMESDATISLCGHFVRRVTLDGEIKQKKYPSSLSGRYGLEKVIHHCFIPSASIMFRNGINQGLPPWYFDLAPITDWPICVLAALSGDVVLLDRVMADCVLTPGSAGTCRGEMFGYAIHVKFYKHIESILPSKWHRLVRSEKGKRYEHMAYALRKQGDFVASREAAFKAFISPYWMDQCRSKTKALIASLVREAAWRLKGG